MPYIGRNTVTNDTPIADVPIEATTIYFDKCANVLAACDYFETCYVSKMYVTISVPSDAKFGLIAAKLGYIDHTMSIAGVISTLKVNVDSYMDKQVMPLVTVMPG